MRRILLRHNFIWVVFGLLFLPGILAILTHFFGNKIILKWMTADYRLGGMTQEVKPVTPTIAHFNSHALQKYWEESTANHLPLRSLFIRMNNQIYYALFKKSHSYFGQIIVGKDHQLFELTYINAYCNKTDFKDIKALAAWADKIKVLNDFFASKGKTFVYVITPSKAEYMPEAIPNRYHCENKGVSPHLAVMTQLLRERNIRFVDGSSIMFAAAKKYGITMFPEGGTHWNLLGATEAANHIITALNQTGETHLQPIKFKYTLTNEPEGSDRDLLNLLNMIKVHDRYQVPKLSFETTVHPSQLKAAFIGGSFVGQLIDVFKASQTFAKMNYYYYFKLEQSEHTFGNNAVKSKVNLASNHVLDNILQADVVILEENAAMTVSNHGELFYETMNKYAFSGDGGHRQSSA